MFLLVVMTTAFAGAPAATAEERTLVEGPVRVLSSDGQWDTFDFVSIGQRSHGGSHTQVSCRWRSSITYQRDTADGGTVAVHFYNFVSYSQCNMSGETKMRRMYVQTSLVQPNGSSVDVAPQSCTHTNSRCDTLFETGPSFSRYPGTGQYNLKVSVIWTLPDSANVWRTGNPYCTRDDTGKTLTCTKDVYFTIT